MSHPSLTLWSFSRSVLANRQSILRLTRRELAQRFRGSSLGLLWIVLTPLLTAAIFTFVFSAIFLMRWGAGSYGPFDFAELLLVGLAVHNVSAESLGRATTLIVGLAG